MDASQLAICCDGVAEALDHSSAFAFRECVPTNCVVAASPHCFKGAQVCTVRKRSVLTFVLGHALLR